MDRQRLLEFLWKQSNLWTDIAVSLRDVPSGYFAEQRMLGYVALYCRVARLPYEEPSCSTFFMNSAR